MAVSYKYPLHLSTLPTFLPPRMFNVWPQNSRMPQIARHIIYWRRNMLTKDYHKIQMENFDVRSDSDE